MLQLRMSINMDGEPRFWKILYFSSKSRCNREIITLSIKVLFMIFQTFVEIRRGVGVLYSLSALPVSPVNYVRWKKWSLEIMFLTKVSLLYYCLSLSVSHPVIISLLLLLKKRKWRKWAAINWIWERANWKSKDKTLNLP